MKYYKVINNHKVIDLISGELQYVKYQPRHQILLLCNEDEAMGVITDGQKCVHLGYLNPFPVDDYVGATLEEISESEYSILKKRHLLSIEEIQSEMIMELIERGIM